MNVGGQHWVKYLLQIIIICKVKKLPLDILIIHVNRLEGLTDLDEPDSGRDAINIFFDLALAAVTTSAMIPDDC